jgi:DnaJ-domain-containing protein 1
MTAWEFVVIIACAVAGFWLVSFIIEAFGRKKEPADQPNSGSGDETSQSREEAIREPTWYEILGVNSAASIDEIKAAYRQRAQQYHPDRVQGLGIELRQVADRKMKELNAAYDSALRGR